jgi:hypothetical protein
MCVKASLFSLICLPLEDETAPQPDVWSVFLRSIRASSASVACGVGSVSQGNSGVFFFQGEKRYR